MTPLHADSETYRVSCEQNPRVLICFHVCLVLDTGSVSGVASAASHRDFYLGMQELLNKKLLGVDSDCSESGAEASW